DFGGGTFDAAVLSGGRVTALRGTLVGGERLDQVIFETRVGPELGLDALPSWLFNEMRSLSGVGLLLADPGLPFLLERFGGPAARAFSGRLGSSTATPSRASSKASASTCGLHRRPVRVRPGEGGDVSLAGHAGMEVVDGTDVGRRKLELRITGPAVVEAVASV